MPIGTINVVNRKVAEKLKVDEAIVKKVNELYFKEVRNNINSLEHQTVKIKDIGLFTVSKRKLYTHIGKTIRWIRVAEDKLSKGEFSSYKMLEINREKLKKLCVLRNKLAMSLIRKKVEFQVKIELKRKGEFNNSIDFAKIVKDRIYEIYYKPLGVPVNNRQ